MPAYETGVRVGLFGIGLDTYWPQFKGLKDKLSGYQDEIKFGLERDGVTVVDAGLVDNLEKSDQAANLFVKEGVDLIFLYISTYTLSSNALGVVKKTTIPVVVLNLQPVSHIDYDYF